MKTPETIYAKYADELKDVLLRDEINVIRVYDDDGEYVEFIRRESEEAET